MTFAEYCLDRHYTLTPIQAKIANSLIDTIYSDDELKKFFQTTGSGKTVLFRLLEEYLFVNQRNW